MKLKTNNKCNQACLKFISHAIGLENQAFEAFKTSF